MIDSFYDPFYDRMHEELYEAAISRGPPSSVKVAKKNAQKHGLTAELEPLSVRDWYRVIVGDANAS